jgi:hypothetical protein
MPEKAAKVGRKRPPNGQCGAFFAISKCLHTRAAQPTIRNRFSSVNIMKLGLCLDFQTAETPRMSNQDRPKPGGTPNQRKTKRGKKAAQRAAPQPELKPELTEAASEVADERVTSVEAIVSEAVMNEPALSEPALSEPVMSVPASAPEVTSPPMETEVSAAEVVAGGLPATIAPAEPLPVGLQTIASAYRDYTQKSLAEATSFVEKLAAARSLDKAVEVQAEFARQACETFAADSRKIRTLYRELFWQSLRFPNWPPSQAQR